MPLHALADAVRRRNLADADIARIIGRPAERGHIGEFIAAHVFDLQLEESAVAKGIDGRFRSGPLAGATVNVKMYGKLEYLLDIRPDGVPDYYLVLTGSGRAMATSRGGTRPLEIERVFLFAGPGLVQSLQGVKLGVACSVRKVHWAAAEIYPEQTSALLPLSEEQRKLLLLFHPAVVAPLRNAGSVVDPEGRYHGRASRRFEHVAEAILQCFPGVLRRTRDVIELELGGEEGVLVVLTPEGAEVRLPTVEWIGPHDAAVSSRPWRRAPLDADEVERLIRDGMAARAAEFRTCRYCRSRVAPEHWHGEGACQGCAERRLGIVD